MKLLRLSAIPIVSFLLCAGATAEITYTNFGMNPPFDVMFGYQITGSSTNLGYEFVAAQFTASVGGVLSKVVLPIDSFSGSNDFYVELLSNGVGVIGTPLEIWSTAGGTPGSTDTEKLLGDGSVSLVAGQTYWLGVYPEGNNTAGGWDYSNSASGLVYEEQSAVGTGYYSNPLPAFQVEVNPVPEPTTLVATLTALVAFRGRKRRPLAP